MSTSKQVTLLDYGAGNVRSVRNALHRLGYAIKDVNSPTDIDKASKLIFPGVGSFGAAMGSLEKNGLTDPLREYVSAGRPFLGICIGMQVLFEGSDENGGVEGLGIVPGRVSRFDPSNGEITVPHIGWNTVEQVQPMQTLEHTHGQRMYFVHSYRAEGAGGWEAARSCHGDPFVAAVAKGEITATQFHPEKSGKLGVEVYRRFLEGGGSETAGEVPKSASRHKVSKRIVACLDVRSNDEGQLVVTKGDGYDVREAEEEGGKVRNLGSPMELAKEYYEKGADEICFLNITAFREEPLADLPMLDLLRCVSESVFVPLTVGGGIRGYVDRDGKDHSALQVASEYFRSGADKVSIGSDAVKAAKELVGKGGKGDERSISSIEEIAQVYGNQAVVVSIDPKRRYVQRKEERREEATEAGEEGPNREKYCWYECTTGGGRRGEGVGVVEVAMAVERLGAGEILLNCIDEDGKGKGFDASLIELVCRNVTIPVVASSGAGEAEHFVDVFERTRASAALAAGIFHRQEVGVAEVKAALSKRNMPVRVI